MNRREAITLLGGAVAWPLAARPQQLGKLPTVGFLGTTTASAWSGWTEAFVQQLRELGWIEGRTIAVESRWGEARRERLAAHVAGFIRLNDGLIVGGGDAAIAGKQATSASPIVFVLAVHPVGRGLVASLSR